MTALVPRPATPTLADLHPKPATDRPRLCKLVLILKLAALVLDPVTLTPPSQWRVELLIHLPRRLAMRMAAMLLPRPAPRPGSDFGSPREDGAASRLLARPPLKR